MIAEQGDDEDVVLPATTVRHGAVRQRACAPLWEFRGAAMNGSSESSCGAGWCSVVQRGAVRCGKI